MGHTWRKGRKRLDAKKKERRYKQWSTFSYRNDWDGMSVWEDITKKMLDTKVQEYRRNGRLKKCLKYVKEDRKNISWSRTPQTVEISGIWVRHTSQTHAHAIKQRTGLGFIPTRLCQTKQAADWGWATSDSGDSRGEQTEAHITSGRCPIYRPPEYTNGLMIWTIIHERGSRTII